MRSIVWTIVCITIAAVANAPAQTPNLVRDINAAPKPGVSSHPDGFASIGATMFFAATADRTGRELYRTQGPGSTTLVVNLGGYRSSSPRELTPVGNALIFAASPTSGVARLYRLDTTTGVTTTLGSVTKPAALLRVGSRVFFTGADASGSELWVTDGTTPGTRPVADIVPGFGSSNARALGVFNGRVYFSAATAATGRELWSTDLAGNGAQLYADVVPGPISSDPASFGVIGNAFCVAMLNATNAQGIRLWRSDGNGPGPGSYFIASFLYPGGVTPFVNFGGRLYIASVQGVKNGLWSTDGTVAGTGPVAGVPERPWDLVASSTALYFTGETNAAGKELWAITGTSGPRIVADIQPGPSNSNPSHLSILRGDLFFIATPSGGSGALWRSNGTTAGTVPIQAFPSSSRGVTTMASDNRFLWLAADDGRTGVELWQSSGTVGTTRLVTDIDPRVVEIGTLGSKPEQLTDFHGILLFTADDGVSGRELWRSDGTAAGTWILADIVPGGASADPKHITVAADRAFFVVETIVGRELWATDGTRIGTRLVRAFPGRANARSFVAAGRNLFFVADDTFSGAELWVSNGTTAGTRMVRDLFPGPSGSLPRDLVTVGPQVFFGANDGVVGRELWTSDGTAIGTRLVRDINVGPASSDPQQFVTLAGRVLFSANNGTTGHEPWVSDGTAQGTSLIVELDPGPFGTVRSFYATYERVFIDEPSSGRLWATDGTAVGTVRLGGAPVFFSDVATAQRRLFMTTTGSPFALWASDGTPGGTGRIATRWGREVHVAASGTRFAWTGFGQGPFGEIWRTDGTRPGSTLVARTRGPVSDIALSAGQIFVVTDDGASGPELFRMDVGAASDRVGVGCANSTLLPLLDATEPVLGGGSLLVARQVVAGSAVTFLVSVGIHKPVPLAPGCFAHVSLGQFAVLASKIAGAAPTTAVVPLPNQPGLAGLTFTLQAVITPSAAPHGFDLTNGVHVRFGF